MKSLFQVGCGTADVQSERALHDRCSLAAVRRNFYWHDFNASRRFTFLNSVSTLKRARPLPDVRTLEEEGLKDYEYASWYGLFAPTGTPRSILDKIYKAANITL